MAIAERVLQLHRLDDLRPDEALVRAAQGGDSEAASSLVERYYPRVRSFVSYLTNGRSNAEDLTQEVFARALGALARFNGNYRFEPWLLRIAKNLVIDEARRRVRQPEVTDPSELPEIEPVPASMDNVWDSVSQQLSTSTVKAALQRLPLRQRTVLVLREIEEMAYADIAHVVGTNVRGVEATLRRARARFRIEVANLESDEAHAAVCRRTLRLVVADDVQVPDEASEHLAGCRECRGKVMSVRRADRLFAALPPVALADPGWHSKVLAGLQQRAVRAAPRGRLFDALGEVFRTGATHVAALPVAQIVEVAASVAIAAVVATAPLKPAPSSPAFFGVDPVPVSSTQRAPGPEAASSASDEGAPEVTAAPSGITPAARAEGVDESTLTPPAVASEAASSSEAEISPAATQESSGLIDGAILPAAGQLLSDPLGTLTGIVDSLPHVVGGTLDAVGGTLGSVLQDPLGVVQDPLGTVGETVDGVTGALSGVPVVGDLVSRLGLRQLTGKLLPPRPKAPSAN